MCLFLFCLTLALSSLVCLMCGTQSRFFFFPLLLLLYSFVSDPSHAPISCIFSLSSSRVLLLLLPFHFPILLSTYRVLIAKSRTDGAHASDAPGESPPHKGIRRSGPVNKKIGKKMEKMEKMKIKHFSFLSIVLLLYLYTPTRFFLDA